MILNAAQSNSTHLYFVSEQTHYNNITLTFPGNTKIEDLPSSVDWRDAGVITDPKNQVMSIFFQYITSLINLGILWFLLGFCYC